MRSKKRIWLTTAVVVALGLATGVTIADHLIHKPVAYAEAAWKQVFDTPRALSDATDAVVLAQAIDVAPGRVALSDKGEGPLPFQLVEFEVIYGLRGAAAGERLTVERTGGVDPSGRNVKITADGGEFVPGEVYLLYLKAQPETDRYYQINHQARYHLKGDHLMAVAPDDPVATRLHGVSLEEGMARAQAWLGQSRPTPAPPKK